MRIYGPAIIEIHDEVLFQGTGAVNTWAHKVATAQTKNTKLKAPLNKRTRKFPGNPPVGSLKKGIGTKVEHRGLKVIGITTTSKANYTIYVIKGTRDQYARNTLGQFMDAYPFGFPLPANNFGRFKRVQRVRGQKGNNFMLAGLQATARKHPSLAGAASIKQFDPF